MEDVKRRGILAIVIVIVLIPIIGLTAAAGSFPVLLTIVAAAAFLYSVYAFVKYQKRA